MGSEDFLVPPKPLPDFPIPSSSSTVKVSMIYSAARIDYPFQNMLQPSYPGMGSLLPFPSFAFLVEHPSGRRLLFDLSIRKDHENLARPMVQKNNDKGVQLSGEKNISDVLRENCIPLESIEAVIWSHYHFDHTGDPSIFPSTTALLVGPGFKGMFPAGWPTDPDCVVNEADWADRALKEIIFPSGVPGGVIDRRADQLKIGRFSAHDYFGDGSFYLLDSPGHAVGHMCALARTMKDELVLLAGDALHHAAEVRPNPYSPLPKTVESEGRSYSSERFRALHPEGRADVPFFRPAEGFNTDEEMAEQSAEGVRELDAREDCLVVLAHDESFLKLFAEEQRQGGGFVELGGWRERGTKHTVRWDFLNKLFGKA